MTFLYRLALLNKNVASPWPQLLVYKATKFDKLVIVVKCKESEGTHTYAHQSVTQSTKRAIYLVLESIANLLGVRSLERNTLVQGFVAATSTD